MAWDLKGKVFDCLQKKKGQRFTTGKIAQWIFDNYRQDCLNKRRNSRAKRYPVTTDQGLINQISRDICTCRKAIETMHPQVNVDKTTDPFEYYYQ
ncbi:MAG: hypothetical protein HAW65_02365 [Alphaproteobacteria bacterium]|nr:hypothetical protein [Alphaproteobacteria bacterium]